MSKGRAVESARGRATAPATVLVVDDEASFHEDLAEFLSSYRTIPAYTGFEAMEARS